MRAPDDRQDRLKAVIAHNEKVSRPVRWFFHGSMSEADIKRLMSPAADPSIFPRMRVFR